MLNYTLKKSNRKTIAISVEPGGKVIVKAPYFVDERKINSIVSEKSDWINEKIEKMKVKGVKLDDGSRISLFGKEYTLKLIQDERLSGVDSDYNTICVYTDSIANINAIKNELEIFYGNKLVEYIKINIEKYRKILGVKPVKVTVRNQKSRWGSCSAKGNLNFNFRLAMVPYDIVDYVIVHELCHLRHMNHSKEFWELVESVVPGWKDARKWLKENGTELFF